MIGTIIYNENICNFAPPKRLITQNKSKGHGRLKISKKLWYRRSH